MESGGRFRVGLCLGLLGIALALVPLGLAAVGVQLSAEQGYILLALAALFGLGAVVALLWSWIRKIWRWTRRGLAWTRAQIRRRWPFALARTVKRLTAENERLLAEKGKLKSENDQLRADRDGQVQTRCWELSRELFKFLEEVKQQDPDETMHQYEQRFKGRVERVRIDLERLGWWKPRESAREKLERPAHPDDLLSLADYLNASGAHRFW